MAGNTYGTLFRITTYGESHGNGIGVVIDGCPAGLNIDESFIASELKRRRPGQSSITTQRQESEQFTIQSGVFEGKSTGTPISIFIPNEDQKSKDYSHLKDNYRPSHADFTYDAKYGIRDHRGGGRSSARETAARVAAGAIAKLFLAQYNIQIIAYVDQIGSLQMTSDDIEISSSTIESNIVRCPDKNIAKKMISLVSDIKKQGNTIGGSIKCQITGIPAGLGEPVFDKLHAELAKAMMSINAARGFEYGSGFNAIKMKGSQHNDPFVIKDNKVLTTTNYSGGIQGGISNGMPIDFRIAFKPVATILQKQESINNKGEKIILKGKGRHDPCVVPRAVPIVEAMSAIVIADFILRK